MWGICAAIAFLVALALHFVLGRWRAGNAVIRFGLVGGAVGLALVLSLIAVYGVSTPTIAGTLLYAFSCELYLFLFTLFLSSVSVNLMLRLTRGTLSHQQIESIYSNAAMVEMRLDRLVENGFIDMTGDTIVATHRGRRLAAAFNRFRRLLGRF